MNTTYVYDFLELFEVAIVKQWQSYGKMLQGTQEQAPAEVLSLSLLLSLLSLLHCVVVIIIISHIEITYTC